MARILIQNVGPIKSGLESNDGFIEISKVTVFIGDQGTGKSTIAKIISTCTWLEKALVRGDFTVKYLTKYNRFKKNFLAYQGIEDYLSPESVIFYYGERFVLSFQDDTLDVLEVSQDQVYNYPKVMYVPAERNFVSSVGKPELVKRLPQPLIEFLNEYSNSLEELKTQVELPVGGIFIKQKGKQAVLMGEDYEINLLKASSGYQSLVPLYVVTKYLIDTVIGNQDRSKNLLNLAQSNKLRKEISKIINKNNLNPDVARIALEALSAKYSYSSLINIVEEPEQNLYPTSQGKVLLELLKMNNIIPASKLILTTHSPYIINYMTLATKAFQVYQVNSNVQDMEVSRDSSVDGATVRVYQLKDGRVSLLDNYQGLPSDENFLNESLEKFNDDFSTMLEKELNG